MGWGNCGQDSKGRYIGYCAEGTCDHPRCTDQIDRGLSYACGGMHGENEISCENYFCSKHLICVQIKDRESLVEVCRECYDLLKEEDLLVDS